MSSAFSAGVVLPEQRRRAGLVEKYQAMPYIPSTTMPSPSIFPPR